MTEKEIMIQALRSCSGKQCGVCLYRGNGIACKQKLMAAAADELERGVSQSDALAVWGFLQTLKDIFEQRAKNTAAQDGEVKERLTADYLKKCAEISALQNRLCPEKEETA